MARVGAGAMKRGAIGAGVMVALATVALAWVANVGPGDDAVPAIDADAAIVLSGDVDYLRVKHGAALLKWGQVKALLLTGQGIGGDSAEAMRVEAIAAGAPKEAIVLETASTSTRENLALSAPIIRARGWHRVALVTSQSHLARALATAHRTMPEVEWLAAPVPDAGPPERTRWLRAEEALKLLWYRVRGWA